jgi:gluconate 2-dehydrogenase gamma chain
VLKRRTFISAGLAVTAVSCGRRGSPWRFLTIEEARTLEAVCGHIVPEDRDPGAVKAGVVHYIDTQLTAFYKPLRKTYRQGIAAINRKGPFADLSPEAQLAELRRFERDPELAGFFDLLVTHTMQGFYGDPRHGGNFEHASWKMLGAPYPPLRGRLRYDLADPAKGERPWG